MAIWTQADIDRLQKALGSVEKTVVHEDGRRITYKDDAEIWKALAAAEAYVNKKKNRRRYAEGQSGF